MAVEQLMLATVADYELATHYLHDWVMLALNRAGYFSMDLINLEGPLANHAQFVSDITNEDPIFVWMNGHGNEGALAGQNSEILLNLNSADLLQNRICYAFSCLTAAQLGPKAIQDGCVSYIGYTEEFIFMYDQDAPSYTEDNLAKWFMLPGTQVGLSLMQGKTTMQAFDDSQYVFQFGIDYWNEVDDQIAPNMLACLYQNKTYQSLLGSPSAVVTPIINYEPPYLPINGQAQAGMGILAIPLILGGIYLLANPPELSR